MFNYPFFQIESLGNTFGDYTVAVLILVGSYIILRLFRTILLGYLRKIALKTKTDIDDMVIGILDTIKVPFYIFVSFFLAFIYLSLAPWLQQALKIFFIIWATYQTIVALSVIIDFGFKRSIQRDVNEAAIALLSKVIKALLWIFGGVFILANFGVDVTSLIAGLGIGGIAIALAVQNILGDLLSAFAIWFDKPFEIGDFIAVGKNSGTVEKIGIKTTRLRSTTGEELIISNQEITNARVQNFKRLTERRVLQTIGVLYETPPIKLEKIPSIIQKIAESQAKVRFDRVHFKDFGASSLDFEISYYIKTNDYKEFMDIREKINLNILKEFKKEKIEIAYPTQTLYIQKT